MCCTDLQEAIKLSQQQKQELMALRRWFLPKMGQLLKDRQRISRALQDSQVSCPCWLLSAQPLMWQCTAHAAIARSGRTVMQWRNRFLFSTVHGKGSKCGHVIPTRSGGTVMAVEPAKEGAVHNIPPLQSKIRLQVKIRPNKAWHTPSRGCRHTANMRFKKKKR